MTVVGQERTIATLGSGHGLTMHSSRWRIFPWLGAVAIALMIPSFVFGPYAFDSGPYNYVWTRQFAEGLARGQIYPRWLPRSFDGLGSPTFFFYPPLAFYVSGLLELAGLSTWPAISAAGLVFQLGSGLTMRGWLKDKSPRAALWACVYMAAPYHLADFYYRGALAEFAAFAWIPLVAIGLEGRPRTLAVAFAGLVLTHLPTAVLVAVFFIGPLLVLRLAQRRSIAPSAAAGLVGLALSGVYLVPALGLQRYVSIDQLWTAEFQPARYSLWTGSVKDYALACAAVCGLIGTATLVAARNASPPRAWPVLALVAAALAVGLVPWVWKLPVIEKVQFPYRILSIAEFAAVTSLAVTRLGRWTLSFTLAAALALAIVGWWLIVSNFVEAKRQDSPDRHLRIARLMPDAPEYLPAGVAPPDLSAVRRVVDVGRFKPADRFAFPIWRVAGGAPVRPGSPVIPMGAIVERRTLPIEIAGDVSSAVGLLALGLWTLAGRRRTSKSDRLRAWAFGRRRPSAWRATRPDRVVGALAPEVRRHGLGDRTAPPP